MIEIAKLLNLLDEKNRLCALYEQCSIAMLLCDDDDLALKLSERTNLAHQIDLINAMMSDMYRSDEGQIDIVAMAVRNACERSELPDEYKVVFDGAQQGFACLNRVMSDEPMIMERLLTKREQLDKQIRSISNTPKILQYLNTGVQPQQSGVLMKGEI